MHASVAWSFEPRTFANEVIELTTELANCLVLGSNAKVGNEMRKKSQTGKEEKNLPDRILENFLILQYTN